MICNSLIRLAAALLAVAGTNVLAAETVVAVQPKFLPMGSSPAPAKRLATPRPSPVLNEMVGTLGADGHVHIQCHHVPNPEHARYERARASRHEER
jgi:hypothetical protein